MTAPPFHYRILIVDDDAVVCEIAEEILPARGFDVRCAEDGFEALSILKSAPADLIIADLNMPRMSGFELLAVVRRRFPQIAVIATSGELTSPGMPLGVLADVFLEKGTYTPRELILHIESLLSKSPLRASSAKGEHAPLWIPLNERGYYVLTCTNCLRSFPITVKDLPFDKKQQHAECDFCSTSVPYFLDLGVTESDKKSNRISS